MRSRAKASASSVLASQAFTAASISPDVTRKPPASSSSRSNFRVASIKAASPRAATSSTMARVAASISADTSRLAPRKPWNWRAKSALLWSRRTGMAAFQGTTAQWRGDKPPSTLSPVGRVGKGALAPCPPCPQLCSIVDGENGAKSAFATPNGSLSSPPSRRLGALAEIAGPKIVAAEVSQLAFEAFDVEPQRPAVGEQQHHAAAGDVAGIKLDSHELEGCRRRFQIDIARLARQHPVEPQRRGQATRRGFPRHRLFPVQPAHAHHQPLFALPPDDVR